MPNLNQIKHEFSEYTHYFSGGNSTQPGLFSLFYGLPGHYWPSILKTESAPPLHLVLKEQGYASKAIWSAQFNAPAFDKTILQAVDSKVSTHSESPSVKNWDLLTTHKAIDYIAKQEHPFYLHLFYRAPHAYCYAAPFSERFKPMASPCQRIFPKKIKREYYNRYKNALYFIDEEIKKIIDELKHQALWDNSVVIISSDHGEEFDDNNQGYWGHTSNFTKYQTQVPLLIHWPGKKPHRTALRKSHYDLNTTLMKDFLNCQNAPKDFSLGHGLFNQKESDPLWVASYNNQGLLLKNKIFTLSRQGQIQLFDEKAQEIPKTPEELEQLSQALLLLNQYQ